MIGKNHLFDDTFEITLFICFLCCILISCMQLWTALSPTHTHMQRKYKYMPGRGATAEHLENYIWTQACRPIHKEEIFFSMMTSEKFLIILWLKACCIFSISCSDQQHFFQCLCPNMTSEFQGLSLKLCKSLLDMLHLVGITTYRSPECLSCMQTQSWVLIVLTMTVVSLN